jgi:hypothetical protein
MIKSEWITKGKRSGKYIVYDDRYKGSTYRTFPYNTKESKKQALDGADEYIKDLVDSISIHR